MLTCHFYEDLWYMYMCSCKSSARPGQALGFTQIQIIFVRRVWSWGQGLKNFKSLVINTNKILLDKMESYGIRGVAKMWFESYFSDR